MEKMMTLPLLLPTPPPYASNKPSINTLLLPDLNSHSRSRFSIGKSSSDTNSGKPWFNHHLSPSECDELRKDIEQRCSKLGLAILLWLPECTFKAGLEQEIESLKNKLAACTRDNLNLQEELSEAYRIKSQLADLHSAEVSKNMEAEKQVKIFQGCVAAAFAERDNAIIEAEKAKEKEEVSQQMNGLQKRSDGILRKNLKIQVAMIDVHVFWMTPRSYGASMMLPPLNTLLMY